MERHPATDGTARALRSNAIFEFILYRIDDTKESYTGENADEHLQP